MKIWKEIPEFDGYEVSNFGEVRCWKSQNGRGERSEKPRLLKQSQFAGRPYWRVSLYRDKKPHIRRVHQLVLEAFVGPCSEGMECCHNDGNPSNNQVDNLRWDTKRANMDDQRTHKTLARGERSALAKISESKAKEIKEALANDSGYGSIRRIAEKTGATYRTVAEIKYGHSWRHV